MQVLTAIGNFCIVSIAIGMVVEIIVMYPIQHRSYRAGIENLLVLLIGGIPIAMPTVLSVTMAIGSHRLSQQVKFGQLKQEVCFIYFRILSILNNELQKGLGGSNFIDPIKSASSTSLTVKSFL